MRNNADFTSSLKKGILPLLLPFLPPFFLIYLYYAERLLNSLCSWFSSFIRNTHFKMHNQISNFNSLTRLWLSWNHLLLFSSFNIFSVFRKLRIHKDTYFMCNMQFYTYIRTIVLSVKALKRSLIYYNYKSVIY